MTNVLQKTEQQISINKLEEIINKMQTNISNLHENITKLKMITGLQAGDFQTVFEFLDTGLHCKNIKFYDGQNNKKPKRYPQKAKLLAIDQFFYMLKLVE